MDKVISFIKEKKQYLIGAVFGILLVAAFFIGRMLGTGKPAGTDGNDPTVAQGNENTSGNDDKDSSSGNNGSNESNENNGSDSNNSNGNDSNGNSSDNSNGNNSNGSSTTYPSFSPVDTGNLTEAGNGYEGREGTGSFNYGEALQKAIIFYELQRSGDLPDTGRCNWRGDSGLNDGSDAGVDLTGGLYDAGDNVKFNLPMAYTSAMLAWSVYEDTESYKESGQYEYILDTIRWVNDYLIKCHPEDEVYYYQVGDGNIDHGWWGPCEVMQMNRPSYCVTKDNPGSCVVGEAAASLAACSVVFAKEDPDYAKKCLEHAISLYNFAETTKSDAGYTAANGFYNSWSGFYDELSWAGTWLYLATGEKGYLDKAETYWAQADPNYKWTMCWDDVSTGATMMLVELTGSSKYSDWMEKNLDYWTVGYNGEKVNYTPKGLAYLDTWGALRYATTEAFIAALYSDWDGCSSAKKETYWNFAKSQIEYALGSTGYSYVVGFGDDYPQHVHHRTAQGSYADNMNEPSEARHTLYGALVGGPTSSDSYPDNVSDYTTSEVACDYNAGFVGILARMYREYGGKTLIDFGAVEEVTDEELSIEAGVNVSGQDFLEVRAFVYNKSAWPARVADSLELRYFIDLTEVYEAGGDASNIAVTTNYSEGAKGASLKVWDEEKHIYYVSIDFSGTLIYPGGQNSYKKEIQFRIRNENGAWDNSNDPSYEELNGNNGSSMVKAYHMALYDNGELVFGAIPPSGENAGQEISHVPGSGNNQNNQNNQGSQNNPPANATATSESVKVEWQQGGGGSNTISLNLTITNTSNGSIDLGDLAIQYYFTKDDGADPVCDCYYSAAVSGDSYLALSKVSGAFSSVDKKDQGADTVCTVTAGESMILDQGGTWTLQLSIHRSDWTDFNTSNDYSAKDVENIVITSGGKIIFGTAP